ncbi:MAG: hypothetical protein LBM26_03730, partial [Methanobrevibacter sp.]|nr:hypothetical protein [Methanobrevibacter sp.]
NFIQGEGIESYSSGLNTLIWLFLGSWFGTLGMWTLINVQESINEFWRKREPNLPIRRSFSNGEILIMLLGIILVIFIIFIYMTLVLDIFSSMTPYPYY